MYKQEPKITRIIDKTILEADELINLTLKSGQIVNK